MTFDTTCRKTCRPIRSVVRQSYYLKICRPLSNMSIIKKTPLRKYWIVTGLRHFLLAGCFYAVSVPNRWRFNICRPCIPSDHSHIHVNTKFPSVSRFTVYYSEWCIFFTDVSNGEFDEGEGFDPRLLWPRKERRRGSGLRPTPQALCKTHASQSFSQILLSIYVVSISD